MPIDKEKIIDRIKLLKERHANLKRVVSDNHRTRTYGTHQIIALKKSKLSLKDEIETLNRQLLVIQGNPGNEDIAKQSEAEESGASNDPPPQKDWEVDKDRGNENFDMTKDAA
jgi:hypothetical protein